MVIDIPLRSLYPWDDHLAVRPILRSAFEQLENVEEFTSARDELFLDLHDVDENVEEAPVWSLWPKLERLAIYNPDVSNERFREGLKGLERLTHLVITRADGLEEIDVQTSFETAGRQTLRVMSANALDRWDFSPEARRMQTVEHRCPLELYRLHVPVTANEDSVIEDCQFWVRDRAIDGSLWKQKGVILGGRRS